MRILLILATALLLAVPTDAQKNCTKGKPCGNSCISRDKVCRIGSGTATSGSSQRERPATSSTRAVAASKTRVPPSTEQAVAHVRAFGTCRVGSVSDGDTFACDNGARVRLLLIDTPKKSQAPYGEQARQALAALIPVGSDVRLEFDVEKQDRYGRLLAYVYRDGAMANEEMARQRYALSLTYPPNVKYVDQIRAAVEDARAARRGLHSGSGFECTPRDYRANRCQ